MMSQSDQWNTPDGLSSIPMKRKRGRPRKYPKLDLEENAYVRNAPNLNSGENAGTGVPSAPPGFLGRNGYQPHHGAPSNGAADVMVGTVVSGVIDATFDGGYLLSVRVGNSATTMRGVIFKPGHYVAVSAENDVAPDVQMIRRNVIPIRAEISHFHGLSPRSRDAIRSVNHVASKRKHMVPVAPQTASPLLSRGNLLPVILQPRNLSEGVPLTSLSNSVAPGPPPTNGPIRTIRVPLANEVVNQSSDLATSKAKQVPSVPPSNGLISTNQIPRVGNQSLVFEGGQNENGTCNQPSTETLMAEAKSPRLPNIPFEKLVTEVVKRIDTPSQAPAHAPSHSTEMNIEGSKSTGSELENDMEQPLVIEPLQSIQPKDYSIPHSKPLEDDRNGKMSELLQVLQESMRESESTTGSRVKMDEPS